MAKAPATKKVAAIKNAPAKALTGKRRRIIAPSVSEPAAGLWSNCFTVGDLIILTGVTARDDKWGIIGPADPYKQSVAVFERMRASLEAADAKMSDIIKLNCYLTDIRFREAYVKARREFFTGDFPPCVVIGNVTLASAELLVEVDAWAIRGSGD